jgi:serine protease inhibitor
MKKYFLLPVILIAFACEKNQTDPVNKNVVQIEIGGGGDAVVSASNEFGLNLFKKIATKEEANKNLFISPTSISLALVMTWNGANSTTEEAMAKTLCLPNLDTNEINAVYRDLMNGLKSVDEQVELSIANSIWYRQDYAIEKEFLSVNQNYYNAKVEGLDFTDPLSKNIINKWVEDQTNGKITNLVEKISDSSIMFLINAIYFHGSWTSDFDKESTHEDQFYLSDRETDTIAMMHKFDTLNYFENDLFQSVELDYGIGNYSMVILLPKNDKSISDIITQMKPGNWDNWMNSYRPIQLKLALPQFKYNYGIDLKEVLSDMGMEIAFTSEADFTGINRKGGLFISSVRHKSFIEVNEDGTEAAAATIVEMVNTSSGDEPVIKYMIVNNPFLFAIREKSTGAILFLGRVANPQE